MITPVSINEGTITPEEFLPRWTLDHINMGTQQTDAAKLSDQLVSDASAAGISRDDLEIVAGKDLQSYVFDSIRNAIEEELW